MSKLSVTFSLIGDKKMRELNRRHRGIDHTTDVLSFKIAEEIPEGVYILGDVVVSKEQAEKWAKKLGHSVEEEIAFLAAHGVLHLLGVHHSDDS